MAVAADPVPHRIFIGSAGGNWLWSPASRLLGAALVDWRAREEFRWSSHCTIRRYCDRAVHGHGVRRKWQHASAAADV
ncbi:MAG: hypothetical protein ACREMY_25260, partial [bacterium]